MENITYANTVIVSGQVNSIKVIQNNTVSIVIKQPVGKVYNFFLCMVRGPIKEDAAMSINVGDHITINGSLGNIYAPNRKYKTMIVIVNTIDVHTRQRLQLKKEDSDNE